MQEVSKVKLYNINDAINYPTSKSNVFIIANEMMKIDGTKGRFFYVFPSFEKFLEDREKYPHCHEILVDHVNKTPDPTGRLVFDFDIPDKSIVPFKKFKKQIEESIIEVVETYFKKVDIELLEFVWSTSENDHKFSKHLTVKNLLFDDWIRMSKIFYKLFSLIWDSKYDWIESGNLVDMQIVRCRGSLRMVGSSKIGGSVLELDDPDVYDLEDSLIRIYREELEEQIVTINNLKKGVLKNVIPEEEPKVKKLIASSYECYDSIDFPEEIYQIAYQFVNGIYPGIFTMGKSKHSRLNLIRAKKFKCPISSRIHHAENAYVNIYQRDDYYFVNYGCYRNCCCDSSDKFCNCAKKTINLGKFNKHGKVIFKDEVLFTILDRTID